MTVQRQSKLVFLFKVAACAAMIAGPVAAAPAKTPKPITLAQQAVLQEIASTGTVADRTGLVGAYREEDDGVLTETGDMYDMYGLTAASDDLPLGAYVEVKNLATGVSAVVQINDRRSAGEGKLMTLSYAAAHRLGVDGDAPGEVKVTFLGMTAKKNETQLASR